jgi:hypothetical protein
MKSSGVRVFSRGCSQAVRRACRWHLAAVLLCAAGAVEAQPTDWISQTARFTPAPVTPAAGTTATGSVIEISASNRPLFDSADGSNRTQQRIDMALLSPGRSAFGVTMGLSTRVPPPTPGFAAATHDGPTGVNLGVQWRYVMNNSRRVDITAWRDVSRPRDALAMVESRDAAYGARVEMQLAGATHNFVADHGFVGMQLGSGARITLHRSGGKPMVYYRNQF